MVNNFSIFIIFYIFIELVFSQTDPVTASESSIIPFQLTSTNKPMLHIGGINEDTGMRIISGIQFQPTTNLLIGGVLSPKKIEEDLTIYYHLVAGYVPRWKFLNISSSMIQIGMHRYRFSDDGDLRWFSFSVMESARFGNFNIKFCLNHLFTQKWEENTLLISTDFKLSKKLHLRPGALAYFTPNTEYTPFLFLSIDL